MLELPRGQIGLFAEKPAINTSATPEEAAKIADKFNTAEYLGKTFFGKEPSILSTARLAGGAITIMQPSGPYSEGAVMVIGKGPKSFDTENVKTETVYDYPDVIQESYWGSIMESLDVFNNYVQSQEDAHKYNVFATENCMVTRTTSENRTSRSIALPHSQVLFLNSDHIEPFSDPKQGKIPHLVLEQTALKNRNQLRYFAERVQSVCRTQFDQQLQDIHVHNRPPYSYSFVATRTGNVKEVREALTAHHHAYKTAALEWVSQQKKENHIKFQLKPQPSYRLYMTYNDGTFRLANSPEFLSHAGVMEAAGVNINRGPQHPRRLESEKVRDLHDSIRNRHEELHQFYAAD